MRCLQLMVGVVLGFCAVASAGDRDAARDVQPAKGAVFIQGLEQLPVELQAKLVEAIRELGPGIVNRAQQQEAVEQASTAVFLTGQEKLWLSDPALAQFLEDVAYDAVVNGVEFADEGLTLRDSGDRLNFRIDTPEGIHLVQMVRENGKLVTKFAAVRAWPDGSGALGLRIQMVDGKVQVDQAREHQGLQSSQGDTAGAGGVADASGNGCASTNVGVCCSFTNGVKIRIVCMCRGQHGMYELCGDTGWLM